MLQLLMPSWKLFLTDKRRSLTVCLLSRKHGNNQGYTNEWTYPNQQHFKTTIKETSSFKNWMLILVVLCENERQRWDASRYTCMYIVTPLISDVNFHITGPKLTFKTYNYRHCDTSTVKHLLFAWPYFREVISLDLFTRLYFRDSSYILLYYLH